MYCIVECIRECTWGACFSEGHGGRKRAGKTIVGAVYFVRIPVCGRNVIRGAIVESSSVTIRNY